MGRHRILPTRKDRRTNGATMLYIGHLRRQMEAYLPETKEAFQNRSNRADRWMTLRVRPEVSVTVEALVHRFKERTGQEITKSEVIAAALSEGLPHLTRSIFPCYQHDPATAAASPPE